MIHVSIVEDDAAFTDTLRRYLAQYQRETGSEFQISCYQNGAEFLEHYSAETDIVFMDIEMPVMDGMKAAHSIRKLDSQVVLIFVTNLTQYAIQGYEVDALDYIVKPVSYSHFAVKLDKAVRNLPVRENCYMIPAKEGFIRSTYDRIYYVESNNHEVLFHTADGVFRSRTTLRSVEQVLRVHGFSRPGNSYLVNLIHVQVVRNNRLVIRGKELPIGRSRRTSFMDDLSAWLGGGHLPRE